MNPILVLSTALLGLGGLVLLLGVVILRENPGQRLNRIVAAMLFFSGFGAVLAIPQFTLYGDARRGRRPDFTAAERPERAEPLFDRFCVALASAGVPVERGRFRAHMLIEAVNDGPVSLIVDGPGDGARTPTSAGAAGG